MVLKKGKVKCFIMPLRSRKRNNYSIAIVGRAKPVEGEKIKQRTDIYILETTKED